MYRTKLPFMSPPGGREALVKNVEDLQAERAANLVGAYPAEFPDFYGQTGFLLTFTTDELAILGHQCLSPLADEASEANLMQNATLFVERCHTITTNFARPVDLRLVQADRTDQRGGGFRIREENHYGHSSAQTRRSWVITLARVLRFFLRAGPTTPLYGHSMHLDHAALSSLTSAATSKDQAQEIISSTLMAAFFEMDRDAMARHCLLPALFCALAVKTAPSSEHSLKLHKATRLAQELTCLLNVVKQAALSSFALVLDADASHELPPWFCAKELMQRPVIRALIEDISVARKIGSAAGQQNVQCAILQGPGVGSSVPRSTVVNGTVICGSDFADVAAFSLVMGRRIIAEALEGWSNVDGLLQALDKRGPVYFTPPAPGQAPLASYRIELSGNVQLTGADVSASLTDWLRSEPGRLERFLGKMDELQALLATGEGLRPYSAHRLSFCHAFSNSLLTFHIVTHCQVCLYRPHW